MDGEAYGEWEWEAPQRGEDEREMATFSGKVIVT
jgi:hypothetical protein